MKRTRAFGRLDESAAAVGASAPATAGLVARFAAAGFFAASLLLFVAACGVFGWALFGLPGPAVLAVGAAAAFLAGFAARGLAGRRSS